MSKINQARDSQALSFGIQVASLKAPQSVGVLSGTPSATVATTAYTSSNANDLAGYVIFTNTSATWSSGSVIYGIIQSNTAVASSVVTVDQWYKAADNTLSGSNPVASANYIIFPMQAPQWYIGISDSVATVAGTETGAAVGGTELTTNGLGRQIATSFTHTAGNSAASIATTFTYTGSSSQTIGRSFTSNSVVATKNFAFFVDQLNGATGYVVASNGDTLAITYSITLTTVP